VKGGLGMRDGARGRELSSLTGRPADQKLCAVNIYASSLSEKDRWPTPLSWTDSLSV